ncbi:OmpA family protein [Marinobacter salexigens]|uniref:OmpA family protein n=1 Tax=Marinobacter salexigens TaxID=1925763 RepID=UPI000C28EA41|nr:OmpA family protein [Marinobacter salexigens]
MPDLKDMTPGEILADSSVATFISELGKGIAAAQVDLDNNSIRQIEAFTTRRDDLGGRSLLDLGLSPAFYHYQYADISCSMQLRMEVGSSDEFGFSAKAEDTSDDSQSGNLDSEEIINESSNRSEIKSAKMTMRADSQGALVLNTGQSFTPAGDNPMTRLADLRRLLTAGDSGIDTLIERDPIERPAMGLNTPTDKVLVNSPTIAFLSPDFDNAVFRIRENQGTDFIVNSTLTVSTTAQADLPSYIAHFESQLQAAGFETGHFTPGARALVTPQVKYAKGISNLSAESISLLEKLAQVLKDTGLRVELEGLTDRQGSQARNITLGIARAEKVWECLVNRWGVPASQVTYSNPRSRGEAQHRADDPTGPEDNQAYRTTSITILDLDYYLVFAGHKSDFVPAEIAPNNIGNPTGPGNAYVSLYNVVELSTVLAGNGVTVEGTSFSFSGSANQSSPGTAISYANNLARDINAAANLSAWATGNVVQVARAQDGFQVQLFTKDNREISISESSNFTITSQFSRSQRTVKSQKQGANRTTAVGVSVDARFSRQFNQEVTGNSAISARLVSIPAPPEFLEQIRAYQNELDK